MKKLINGALLALMVLFIAVQYNDPDGWLWMLIYSIPAITLLFTFYRAKRPWQTRAVQCIRWISVAILAVGVLYYWPDTTGFWKKDVWWNVEGAREGMGVMIALVVALYASTSAGDTTAKPAEETPPGANDRDARAASYE